VDILGKETQRIVERPDIRAIVNDAIKDQPSGTGKTIVVTIPPTPVQGRVPTTS
jgi:hypothetical protein